MIIVCASCGAKNRVPEEKLAVHPNCGQCHQPLLTLAPIELNEQNFSQFIANTDLPVTAAPAVETAPVPVENKPVDASNSSTDTVK